MPIRNLIVIFGDQLNSQSHLLKSIEPDRDAVWMAEVDQECTHVRTHKHRIIQFLAAMRHFRDELRNRGLEVFYHELTNNAENDQGASFQDLLSRSLDQLRPRQVRYCLPGDERVARSVESCLQEMNADFAVSEECGHFYGSLDDFREWSDGRRSFLMEHFYRRMRRRHDILVEADGEPTGGHWNLDAENRRPFPKNGPPNVPPPVQFEPTPHTQAVSQMVEVRFASHPGSADNFRLPVTREQSLTELRDFIDHRLPHYGQWQDAMWHSDHDLFHSRLSTPLNLKLLNPRECVNAAVEAWSTGSAALNSVEGFVRQILGWREYVRGIYHTLMPDYAQKNTLQAQRDLPSFFWDGNTEMHCIRSCINALIETSYVHHIERLMVLGNFAQLWGTNPYAFHEWHMAMYADAVDWVSLPNTVGMSQFADGGIVGTKPYCSTGNYINKMSNYCKGCRYDYRKRIGDDACPFTTLYWDFLDRQAHRLQDNRRMKFAYANLRKLHAKPAESEKIRERAEWLFENLEGATENPGSSESS